MMLRRQSPPMSTSTFSAVTVSFGFHLPASILFAHRNFTELFTRSDGFVRDERFVPYPSVESVSLSSIQKIKQERRLPDDWVVVERISGQYLALYLMDERTDQYAKRSGVLDPNEHFRGYHVLKQELVQYLSTALRVLKTKKNLPHVKTLILHGKLFGAKYDHPAVPKTTKVAKLPDGKTFAIAKLGNTMSRYQFPQYHNELQWMCSDIQYCAGYVSESRARDSRFGEPYYHNTAPHTLNFDEFSEVCSQIPGMVYATPLARGTLDQCLSFEVDKFQTPLPAKLGLGNFLLENNWAEGVHIRNVMHGTREVEGWDVQTAMKIYTTHFRQAAVRASRGSKRQAEKVFLPTTENFLRHEPFSASAVKMNAKESAALMSHVSENVLMDILKTIDKQRVVGNAKAKEDVALRLAECATKCFLGGVSASMRPSGGHFVFNTLVQECYSESLRLVTRKWDVVETFIAEGKAPKGKPKKSSPGASVDAAETATLLSKWAEVTAANRTI